MVSVAVYGAIAAVIVHLAPRARVPVIVGAILLVAAIGLSRVYLGVHWPLDVLAGYAAAIPLVAVTVHLVRRVDRLPAKQSPSSVSSAR
jgi:membrane-associated phospholipid phosphatase